MPKNPDLVPTVIVDVNGRTTIVHKLRKLFGGSSPRSAAARFPAPAVLSPGARKSTVVDSLMKMLPVPDNKDKAKRLSDNLHRHFSVESLHWFDEVLSEGGPLAYGVGKHLTGTQFTMGTLAKIDADDVETDIRNNVMFYKLLGADDYAMVDDLVHGLWVSEQFNEVVDFTGVTEPVRDQCVAVMTAALNLSLRYPAVSSHRSHPVKFSSTWDDNKSRVLKEPLFSFVMDNPSEVAEIVDTVIEHKTTDTSVLRGLMSGIQLPLADGAL